MSKATLATAAVCAVALVSAAMLTALSSDAAVVAAEAGARPPIESAVPAPAQPTKGTSKWNS